MKHLVVAVLGALLATSLTAFSAPSASAHHKNYFGDSSRSVAKHIGCKRFHRPRDSGGPGEYHLDSGVCRLKGKRVNVITFRGPAKQREWNAAARFGLPSGHWWANGRGALVTADNGNKPAAKVGARALPGKLVKAF